MTVREIHDLVSQYDDIPKQEFMKICLDKLSPEDLMDMSMFMEILSSVRDMAFQQGVKAGAEDFKNWLIEKGYNVPDVNTEK